MDFTFDNNIPIYVQLLEYLKIYLISGVFKPGDKLPSVRDFANTFKVNPNTMQKALSELEREGVLVSQRTLGRFVAENMGNANSMRDELSEKYIVSFVKSMRELGYNNEDIIRCVSKYLEEEKI